MSSTTTLQTPDASGPTYLHWHRDEHIKTAKCFICSERVRHYSYQCDSCRRRICSECVDGDGHGIQGYKDIGHDFFTAGCWPCRFDGSINPEFRDRIPPPPFREPASSAPSNRRAKRKWESSPENEIAPTQPSKSARSDQQSVSQSSVIETTPTSSSSKSPLSAAEEVHVSSDIESQAVRNDRVDLGVDSDPFADTTVVIGAGIIGLSVGLGLASWRFNQDNKHNVIIIDACDGPCQLASGHSAGFLMREDLNAEPIALYGDARLSWTGSFRSNTDEKLVGFRSTIYHIGTQSNEVGSPTLSWLPDVTLRAVKASRNMLGRVDPVKLAKTFIDGGRAQGARYHFNCRPVRVERHSSGRIAGIRCVSTKPGDSTEMLFACSDIVLAAGPFTTGLFANLFPENTLKLENRVQTHDWVGLHDIPIRKGENVGIRMPVSLFGQGDGDSSETYTSPIRMVASRRRRSVTISACNEHIISRHLTLEDVLKGPDGRSENLRGAAAAFIARPHLGTDPAPSPPCTYGAAFVSSGNAGQPVMGPVPARALGGMSAAVLEHDKDRQRSGVWLCYGFGNHGTFLAPTAMRLMAEMVRGRIRHVFRDGVGMSNPADMMDE